MNLKNKNVLFLGSSVTFGATDKGVSFADILSKRLSFNMIKSAVCGTTLADINDSSYPKRLMQIDISTKIDLFVCQLSTNDAGKNLPIHETEKAIRFIIEYVKKTFNCPIIFFTGTYFENENYAKLVELIIDLQKEYGFYLLDLYNDKKMRSIKKTTYQEYMIDPIHPTILGYEKWWSPKFIELFNSI